MCLFFSVSIVCVCKKMCAKGVILLLQGSTVRRTPCTPLGAPSCSSPAPTVRRCAAVSPFQMPHDPVSFAMNPARPTLQGLLKQGAGLPQVRAERNVLCSHTNTHTHTHTHTHTCTDTHIHTRSLMPACTRSHRHTCPYTCTHSHAHSHALTHTHTHSHTQMHIDTHAHANAHSHTHIHTHTHTHTHTQYTHTHTHMHACIHTHTNSLSLSLSLSRCLMHITIVTVGDSGLCCACVTS